MWKVKELIEFVGCIRKCHQIHGGTFNWTRHCECTQYLIDMSKGTTSMRGVWFSFSLPPALTADLHDAWRDGALSQPHRAGTRGKDGQRLPTKEWLTQASKDKASLGKPNAQLLHHTHFAENTLLRKNERKLWGSRASASGMCHPGIWTILNCNQLKPNKCKREFLLPPFLLKEMKIEKTVSGREP